LEFMDATPHPRRSNSLIQFDSNFSQFTNNR
jgi:hypothetical protein